MVLVSAGYRADSELATLDRRDLVGIRPFDEKLFRVGVAGVADAFALR